MLPPVLANDDARSFWSACSRRRLAMPRCDSCGRLRWYPQPLCPRCCHDTYTWVDLGGRASLFTFTVVHRAFHLALADEVPYVAALVTPEEDGDVRLVTRISGCDPASLVAGMELRVDFVEQRGRVYPLFVPCSAGR